MTDSRRRRSPPGADAGWDLLVVGGGTAGIVGAKTAARLGARVLLVERGRTGGDCLWTGCVPSKALLAAADAAAAVRRGVRLGVTASGVEVDFARVMQHVHDAVARIAPVDSAEALTRAGVTVRTGQARLTSAGTAEVCGRQVFFDQALLATGASPAVPDVPGLAELDHLTSDTVWDLSELPSDLVVLGGGSIGCELAQAFARLGSRVTLVEAAPRLLTREDPAAAALVEAALVADGVRVRTGSAVVGVEQVDAAHGVLCLADGERIGATRLLVALGRTPRTTGIGLDRAGVAVDARGFVVVDDTLRTTHPRIWAAGDLTGHPQFTHAASVHGSLAAANAVLGLRRRVDVASLPRVTFTDPEVAAVGVSTDALATDGAERLRFLDSSHQHVDRAVAEGDTDGFARLAVDRRGRVRGATVVGPRAGETLAELTLAVARGLTTRQLAGVTHPYPTYGDGPWNAVIGDVRAQLERPSSRRVLGGLARTRRWWVGRV